MQFLTLFSFNSYYYIDSKAYEYRLFLLYLFTFFALYNSVLHYIKRYLNLTAESTDAIIKL